MLLSIIKGLPKFWLVVFSNSLTCIRAYPVNTDTPHI